MTTNKTKVRVPEGYLKEVNSLEPIIDGQRLSKEVRSVIEPCISVRISQQKESRETKIADVLKGYLFPNTSRSVEERIETVQTISFDIEKALFRTVGVLPVVSPFVDSNPTNITKLMAVLGVAGWISTSSAVELDPQDAFVYAVGYDRATRTRRKRQRSKTITEDELVWEVFFMRWSLREREFLQSFVDDDAVRGSVQRLVDLGCLTRIETKRGEQLRFNEAVATTQTLEQDDRSERQERTPTN